MFVVGKSFFSEILSKFNIQTIATLSIISIPLKMLAVGPLGPLYSLLFAWHELGSGPIWGVDTQYSTQFLFFQPNFASSKALEYKGYCRSFIICYDFFYRSNIFTIQCILQSVQLHVLAL